jgi:hypothetical protein
MGLWSALPLPTRPLLLGHQQGQGTAPAPITPGKRDLQSGCQVALPGRLPFLLALCPGWRLWEPMLWMGGRRLMIGVPRRLWEAEEGSGYFSMSLSS